ncbi:MAG: hypothetical protein IKG21_07205 [Atopobiaceae bacterium]|nr:hypothetical protein [Atopobiaceae bacterium]
MTQGLVHESPAGLVLVAPSNGKKPEVSKSVRSAGLSEAILSLLEQGSLTRKQISQVLAPQFGGLGNLGERIYRTLKKLEATGKVTGTGSTRARVWSLAKANDTRAARGEDEV